MWYENSLVVLGKDGKPLLNAISWMDERSVEECAQLAARFDAATCEAVTGQMAVLPTWPATKIAWLRRHRPEVFAAADCYMLLKDYIVYCLTGVKAADMSIATFSFYFDIYKKCYWQEMLSAIGITEAQLPRLCEPCSTVGTLHTALSEKLGIAPGTQVNVGTLDHFAGMIGTGNIAPGGITLSTGTVMALAAMCAEPAPKNSGIAMHYGFLPDTHVMLPVAESGGVSLEWFRRTCMHADYDEMNRVLATYLIINGSTVEWIHDEKVGVYLCFGILLYFRKITCKSPHRNHFRLREFATHDMCTTTFFQFMIKTFRLWIQKRDLLFFDTNSFLQKNCRNGKWIRYVSVFFTDIVSSILFHLHSCFCTFHQHIHHLVVH